MIYHQPVNSRGDYNYNAAVYQDTVYEAHFHKNFELIYVLYGELAVMVNGVSRQLTEGDTLLIPPNAVHAFKVQGKSKIWVGVFSRDFVPAYAKDYEKTTFSPFRCQPAAEAFLQEQLFTRNVPELYTLIGCLYLACAQCVQYAAPVARQGDTNVTDIIIHYVAEHYTEHITLRNMAEALGYEYHYFSRVFHDCFNMNFTDFISIYRVEAASQLLADTDMGLTDIAMESGFQSVRNFNRVFKKLSGRTPGTYRSKESRKDSGLNIHLA